MVEHRGGMILQPGYPAGLAAGHAHDHVVQRLRRPVRRGQREVRQAAPQHQPQQPGHGCPDRPGRHERGGHARPVGRPQQHGEQRVQDHRAGSAVHRARAAAQHTAEAFAEPPHTQRPRDRGGQRHSDRGTVGDSQPKQQLNGGEDRVEQHQMVLNEGRVPADRTGDDTRVPRRTIPDHLPEHRAVHGRLVLQQAVKKPGGRQDQLQHPARVHTGRGSGTDTSHRRTRSRRRASPHHRLTGLTPEC